MTKRPVWFIFSGMGSQWSGMGKYLLNIPIFAESIRKCDAILKPKSVDIYDILTNEDPKLFDNILNSFVGIAAIQVNNLHSPNFYFFKIIIVLIDRSGGCVEKCRYLP